MSDTSDRSNFLALHPELQKVDQHSSILRVVSRLIGTGGHVYPPVIFFFNISRIATLCMDRLQNRISKMWSAHFTSILILLLNWSPGTNTEMIILLRTRDNWTAIEQSYTGHCRWWPEHGRSNRWLEWKQIVIIGVWWTAWKFEESSWSGWEWSGTELQTFGRPLGRRNGDMIRKKLWWSLLKARRDQRKRLVD